MTSDERKLAKSSLISLEIDPASILSLSKGVIFDTIVHNIEYTLNNRRTDPLPWKLIGMSLICDPSRNKKYLHKLQKMQCVPSVICTQIYHSKLIKSESGVLTTPGRKITLATTPRKRLTGIIVCRSIDELLYMESSTTENVHFIQYKLLCYERIATRELVNGPKLSSVGDKIIKTVFDFELTQNNGFPRQLLPVAVISFGRQDGTDLIGTIRNFLDSNDHKTYDKSYLVTSINVEMDRLREEQERKEDAEIEQQIAAEKIQRRQPLADLSKKSTDAGNASSEPIQPRVPPLKIKCCLPNSMLPQLDPKFQCSVKLDRVDLSSYTISNLPNSPPNKPKKSNELPSSTKSLTITKPHEHHKPLKRLNNSEPKKQSSVSSDISKNKPSIDSTPVTSVTNPLTVTIPKNVASRRSTASTLSPIYRPKPLKDRQKDLFKKTKIQREALPSNYHCFISLTQLDLSMYNIDIPPTINFDNPIPMDTESTITSSPASSTISGSTNISIKPEKNSDTNMKSDIHLNFPHVVDRISTPDLNEPETNTNTEISSPNTDESILAVVAEVCSLAPNEIVSEMISEMVTQTTNEVLSSENDQTPSITMHEESIKTTSSSDSLPSCTKYSPVLPPLDDDPISFSIENPQISIDDPLGLGPQDYIIIVPCSDDEDDFDDNLINVKQENTIKKELDIKPTDSLISPSKISTLVHPSLNRVLGNTNRLTSRRLSISSSSSSCSSISVSILHAQTPDTPLNLTEIQLPQKVLNKKQHQSREAITFNRYDFCVPTIAQEPLIDPRLIYRLQSITTDLRWEKSCTQCSISSTPEPLFMPANQTILYDRQSPLDFIDPRRDSLKLAILNLIYQRIKLLVPNIFILNSNQFQKFLYEQTIFNTNCSLHLEYLLHKLKQSDDGNFFPMIKTNDEFQLSPFVAQLIFK